jgi:hypothetical protein
MDNDGNVSDVICSEDEGENRKLTTGELTERKLNVIQSRSSSLILILKTSGASSRAEASRSLKKMLFFTIKKRVCFVLCSMRKETVATE